MIKRCKECDVEPRIALIPNDDGTLSFSLVCPKCGKKAELIVDANGRAVDGAVCLNDKWREMND